MHIPDGFLSGPAVATGGVLGAAGIAYCLRRVKAEQRERDLPVAGLAAAFFLVGDAPMVPVTVGTQGHLLGGLLACALLGPWLGACTIAVVCAIQALAFGDGGVSTIGLEVCHLALIPAFVGYPLLLGLRRLLPQTPNGLAIAGAVAAWISVVLAAGALTAEQALFAVVDLNMSSVAASTLGAYAIVGVVEGALTALVLRALLHTRPDLVRVGEPIRRQRAQQGLTRLKEQTSP